MQASAILAGADRAFRFTRRGQRLLSHDGDERVQLGIQLADPLEALADDIDARQ